MRVGKAGWCRCVLFAVLATCVAVAAVAYSAPTSGQDAPVSADGVTSSQVNAAPMLCWGRDHLPGPMTPSTTFGYDQAGAYYENNVGGIIGTVFHYPSSDPLKGVSTTEGTFPAFPSTVTFVENEERPLYSLYCVVDNDEAVELRAYGGVPGSALAPIGGAIYTCQGDLVAATETIEPPVSTGWRALTFPSPPTLQEDAEYALVLWGEESEEFMNWQLLGDIIAD
ncbi:MAG: hypothetical protein ACOX9R_14025 [Armatimonadota bacterium]|jgi:hypothetical protein